MKKSLIALCLTSAFSVAQAGSSLELNISLTDTNASRVMSTNSGTLYCGEKNLTTKRFNIRIDASKYQPDNSKTSIRDLKFFITDNKTDCTSIYLFDKGANGITAGDYLLIEHNFADNKKVAVTVTYHGDKMVAETEIYSNGKIVSMAVEDSSKKGSFFLFLPIIKQVIRDPVEKTIIENALRTGNITYNKLTESLMFGNEPDLPYEGLMFGIQEGYEAMSKSKDERKKAEKFYSTAKKAVAKLLNENKSKEDSAIVKLVKTEN